MNNWRAVSYIFLGIGVAVLVSVIGYGLYTVISLQKDFPYYPQSFFQSAFLSFIAPYVVLASVSFAVSFVALYIGGTETKPSLIEENAPP